MGGKRFLTHRLAYILQKGSIPEGKWGLHKGDKRRCVRGDHLFLGTVEENNKDMFSKGRHAHGEYHPFSKLSASEVIAIRVGHSQGVTMKRLGATYGVAPSQIWNVIHRKTWKEVGQDSGG